MGKDGCNWVVLIEGRNYPSSQLSAALETACYDLLTGW